MKILPRIHKHLKQHHKKYVRGLFAGFALVKTFVLLAGFLSLSSFLHIFADEIPLQEVYFGQDSLYTTNRVSNACNPANMTVEYLSNYATSGINTIPEFLSGNTLYVLLSGSYISSRSINLASCSALIGSGEVTLYSAGDVGNMLHATNKENIIISNLSIDGINTGTGGTHPRITNGISLETCSNTTVTDIASYNSNEGIYLGTNSSNNTIRNSQAYNNNYGIYLGNTTQTAISNSQLYNNIDYGIFTRYSTNTIINNTQAYNNMHGIGLINDSNNSTINNAQVYNNSGNGLQMNSNYNTINNLQVYNNGVGIATNMNNNTYYGTLKFFSNTANSSGVELLIGSDSAFFSGGVLDTASTMSCDWVTNPINTSQIFLMPLPVYNRGGQMNPSVCNRRGQETTRTPTDKIRYLYGSEILKQTRILRDTGNGTPVYSWSNESFDANKYVAERSPTLNGSLILASGQSSTFASGIEIQLTTEELTDYTIYGDFVESPLGGNITDAGTRSITLTSGYNTKSITVRYSTGNKIRTITNTIAYLDPMILVYYGSGSLYTSNRRRNDCNPQNMTIQYLNPGTNTIPATLSGNTLYVLLSGSHITSRQINLASCAALIGSGDVMLYSTNNIDSMLYANGKDNIVINNLKINGANRDKGKNNKGMYFYSSANSTIYNVQSYDNTYQGMYLHSSQNITINNLQTNNNQVGIYIETFSNNNSINNSQTYNNSVGMYIHSSSNNTINNTQVYNNSQGLYFQGSTNNTIHNVQAYNNDAQGIYFSSSSNNILHNAQAYNNGRGVDSNYSADNRYFGTLKLFDNEYANIWNNNGNGVSTGADSDFPNFFSGGILNTGGTMSCDRITNPVNSDGTYLIDVAEYPNCDFNGQNWSWTPSSIIQYTYGSSILKQTRILRDTGNGTPVYSWSDESFDTNKYVAELNMIDKTSPIGSITFDPTSGSLTTLNVLATLTLNESGSITSTGGNTHIFRENGAFTFTFEDLAGNTGEAIATVTWIQHTSNNGGGGGGSSPSRDICPAQRDCSDTYYDNLCGKCPLIEKIIQKTPFHGVADKSPGSIKGSKLSKELNNGYLRAYEYDITTMDTIQRANMTGKLLRKDMAKMISNFAINILGKDVSTGINCKFSDMETLPKETQYYAIAACRLGLMGYESDGITIKNTFDPQSVVDRAQFGTILSRLIRGKQNNGGETYYQKHLIALQKEGIMNNINTPYAKELRGRVIVMMKRVFDKK